MRFQSFLLCLLLGLGGSATGQVGHLTAPPLMRVEGAETPIALTSVAVTTELSGGLAQTTVELVFRNPNRRDLEGELQFPLQSGQQITGFALDFDGLMRPAVPVPKGKGQAVFEAIERRNVDPALLQKTEGNHFKLRVYPIRAGGTRRVRLSYTEALQRDGGDWKLHLPLHFTGTVASFDWRVVTSGQRWRPVVTGSFGDISFDKRGDGYQARIERRQYRPDKGLDLRMPASSRVETHIESVGGEHYFVADIPVEGGSIARPLPRRVGLLWDSSASARKRDIASELAVLDRYFQALGNAEVQLIRLRDRAETVGAFKVEGGDWGALRRALQDTVYDGATDPGGWQPRADIEEYLLVSDGLFNYGERRFPALSKSQRLYALNSAGASADGIRLDALAARYGGRAVHWQRSGEVEAIARMLLEEGPRLLSMSALGATDLASATPFPDGGYLRVAGRLTEPGATLELQLRNGGKTGQVTVPISAGAPRSTLAGRVWASHMIRSLSADPERNRAAIERLGPAFGIVTSETSLIVLDTVEDYVRYAIEPPSELRAEYARLKAEQGHQSGASRQAHLDQLAREFADKVQWWEKIWPKTAPPKQPGGDLTPRRPLAAAPPAPPAPATMAMERAATSLDRVEVTGSRISPEELKAAARDTGATITLQAWEPDSPYAKRLRAAPPDEVYAIYLDERDSYDNSTAFYLDVADVLLDRQQRALALRVLSNLAEMDLENRHILRVLGYRLMQADEPALAVPVFERIVHLAEEEPQSFRDLGLAHAANRQYQAAIDRLYEVALRDWDDRFPGVALIALGELNAIVATPGVRLDTSRIDARLLRNLPMDLRVVLSWDSDNSDMDLWVTDPNGEKCFYGHRSTYQGGRISNDFTGGYGPEEFVLRDAKPGKYKIEANFFGDRQQLVTGATTLHLWLSTGFGTASQRDRKVTLRLRDAAETVLVGEFEVK